MVPGGKEALEGFKVHIWERQAFDKLPGAFALSAEHPYHMADCASY